ncbi:hypothetical protein [Actinacidiphila bryophytorum]|uniref:Uncharacterized protein n=1 Tax=Actinacidiphila bryophytorum TaxID=1436133 RepID=A0A9W4MBY9_9ACTN|nr:hypothetical protein [Actinacidiphila bryophytorum]MBM9438115.1 hypothetical protein [Actinacidiphila bryophytorum]MBN6543632.1 hypothetical protein [Actinacidiphila bryophytorum]CAG7647434.1 conserved exported hypothetical protein [Actinacidiphila bryophytorum]
MFANFRRKTVAMLASATVLAAGMLTVGAGSAGAAGVPGTTYSLKYWGYYPPTVKDWQIVDNFGNVRGEIWWSQDPSQYAPGDSIMVSDEFADGYGVSAEMDVPDYRIATTNGHNSPYTSPWKSGDLPEGHNYPFTICLCNSQEDAGIFNITVTS